MTNPIAPASSIAELNRVAGAVRIIQHIVTPRSYNITISVIFEALYSLLIANERAVVNRLSVQNLKPEEILSPQNFARALKLDHGRLLVHPLIIAKRPEEVLSLLALSPTGVIPRVSFLQDNLTEGPGVDAGGLRKQLLSDLFKNLLDGDASRMIGMFASFPQCFLPCDANLKNEATLKNLGIMMGRIWMGQCLPPDDQRRIGPLVTGRVLPDDFFKLITYPDILNDSLSESQFLDICQNLIHENKMRQFLNYLNDKLRSDEQQLMKEFHLDRIQDLKPHILKIFEPYHLVIRGARLIALGMRQMIDNWDRFRSLDPVRISEMIQGKPFSREDIASRIKIANNAPQILQTKVEWLRQTIKDPNTTEDWIKKLIYSVTGQSVVTLNTEIKIVQSMDNTCSAHTCFNQLAIPVTHTDFGTSPRDLPNTTDRQKFINNLNLLLATGSDFQMA